MSDQLSISEQKKSAYLDFLLSKIKVAEKVGIQIDPARLHPSSKPHQIAIIPWALSLGRALLAPDCGLGKGQPFGSKVLTPEGWKEIQDLLIGDSVIASDGNPYRVTGVFPKQEQNTYRFHFSDGSAFVVDEDHLHIVKTFNDKARGKDWRVLSTKELLTKNLRYGVSGKSRTYHIPTVAPVCFPENPLPIHPYVLGVLLGDGWIKQKTSFSNPDQEVSARVASLLPEDCYLQNRQGIEYNILSHKHNSNSVTNSLRSIGLFGLGSDKKFIPQNYLFTTVKNRLELLRGLMDTDGYGSSCSQFYTTSDQLKDDVVFLIRSLGGLPSVSIKNRPSYTHNGEKKYGKDCHIVSFSLATFNPFYLSRKAESWNSRPRDNIRSIDRIEFEKVQKTVCISVDSPDHSYVTENFIVTHNTHISIEILRILHEEFGGKCLIVTELGASETFCNPDPAVGEGARLGVPLEYVVDTDQGLLSACDIVVTNYERVRMGSIDFSRFTAVVLDEGNYIKNMASETTDALRHQLAKVKYKFVATATPSPNETLELINYAHVLGIADRGGILTRFFQRNSTKAGELTLHPQHEADFWLWVHSWMVAIEKPSDLGFPDEGYDLPELEIVWHEVKINKVLDGGIEKNGQAKMFMTSGNSLPDNAKIKRESIDVRVAAVRELIDSQPADKHWLIWHHLEDERKALQHAFASRELYGEIFGSQQWESRERMIVDFTKGDLQYLSTKPSLSAVGCNFQKFCCDALLVGIDNDWNLLYQLMKRIHRFGQTRKCTLHIFYLPEEYSIVQNLREKQRLHNEQRAWLRSMVRAYGLNHDAMIEERKRTLKTSRKVYQGQDYTAVNTDAVLEWIDLPDNSIDLFNSSFPFGNHYEYTNFYNDFGHNGTNLDFIRQMDYFLPELFRTMKPGRIAAVHLKNRIHYGSVTGLGFSIFHRFTHLVCDAMEKHGFHTMGFHYIPTCVVGENNQTYRLTYGELKKDSTKMGSGIPEEIWLFRKPPSSNLNAYADMPVTHNYPRCPACGNTDFDLSEEQILYRCNGCDQYMNIEELRPADHYSLAEWQIDADAYWGSSGNRLLTPSEMKTWGLDKIRAWWNRFNLSTIYDYDQHIELLQNLDDNGKLSRTFTTLPLQSNTPYIWSNVNRMHGLNMEQSRRKQQNHICPQPFDEPRRIINLYSNPGELVADSFGGLFTTSLEAIKLGRKAFTTELNDVYAQSGNFYLKEAEQKKQVPTLFDFLEHKNLAS